MMPVKLGSETSVNTVNLEILNQTTICSSITILDSSYSTRMSRKDRKLWALIYIILVIWALHHDDSGRSP